MCINGTGILNAWTKRLLYDISYDEMNELAESVAIGSNGLTVLPFGNGAERMLGNKNIGAQIFGLDFNHHGREHICRGVQEGIVFSFMYGMEIMKETGIEVKTIRIRNDNACVIRNVFNYETRFFCFDMKACLFPKVEKIDGN